MAFDLIRALLAAIVAGVIPGYYWARLLCDPGDRAVRLTCGIALSMMLVPTVALVQIYLLGTSVTLSVAVFSVCFVFLTGLAAYLGFGPAGGSGKPLNPHPAPLTEPALAVLFLAFGILLALVLGVAPAGLSSIAIALLLLVAGGIYLYGARRLDAPPVHEEPADPRGRPAFPAVERFLLPAVLLLVLVRGYLGPVRHDWPYLRGIDQYTQAIMTNLMLSEGSTETYMVYPPGFHILMAAISRFSGLEPLKIFPVLGPALLLLPPLALYVLARRLWGWEVGVAAALFSGLILGSSYEYLAEARYPHLLTSQFLIVLTVAALVGLYAAPSLRAGLGFVVFGSSVVLYHHVGSYYLASLLGLVGLLLVPYLLLREPRRGLALLGSLALLFSLSVLYAWDTYDLPRTVTNLLVGTQETGAAGAAVTGAIGTQKPYELGHLPGTLSEPVLWLGVLGALLSAANRRRDLSYALALATLLLWALLMFVGSRTALSGFPERFERDLGVPLALFAAFACVAVLRSWRVRHFAAVVSAMVVLAVGAQAAVNLQEDGGPSPDVPFATARISMTPSTEAAGEWLERHNTGGNIVVTPYLNQLPSRAMLAMSGFSAVQTFTESRIERNRDLPPSGQKPPRDALYLMEHPGSQRAREIIESYDVRYIVLYKGYPSLEWQDFERLPRLYRKTFENDQVVIYKPR